MADDRKVRITIETKADGTGAKAVARDLEKISSEISEITRKTDFYDFDAALKKTIPRLEDLDNWTKKATASKAQFGVKIQQVGFQVQDFAVQVSSGTNALTALAQQGSQLLGIFGPGGAMAGALLAIGAIAVKAFSDTENAGKSASEKAQALAEALEEVRKKGEDLSKEQIDFSLQAMQDATAQAEALRDRYKETIKAQDDSATAQLSNLAKVTAAIYELDRLEGLRLDKQRQASVLAEIERKKREEAARQQAAAAQKQLDDAKAKHEADLKSVADAEEQRRVNRQNLDDLRQMMGELKERKRILEETAKQVSIADVRGAGPGAAPALLPTSAALQAQSDLARTDFDARIAAIEGQIKGILSSGEAMKALEQATEAAAVSKRTLDDLSVAVPIKLQEIQDSLTAANFEGKVDELKQSSQTAIEATTAGLAGLKDLTPKQQAIADEIKATTADGVQTAEEALANAQRFRLLLSTLKTNQVQTGTNIDDIIQILYSFDAKFKEQARQIQGLKEQLGQPIR